MSSVYEGMTFGPAPPAEGESISEGRRHQLERMTERNHRLTVDGEVLLEDKTYEECRAAIPEGYHERWSIDAVYKIRIGLFRRKVIAERSFNVGFGYRGGTTSTADLARMGVPIHPNMISEEKR